MSFSKYFLAAFLLMRELCSLSSQFWKLEANWYRITWLRAIECFRSRTVNCHFSIKEIASIIFLYISIRKGLLGFFVFVCFSLTYPHKTLVFFFFLFLMLIMCCCCCRCCCSSYYSSPPSVDIPGGFELLKRWLIKGLI